MNILELFAAGLCGITGGWFAKDAWAAWYSSRREAPDESQTIEIYIEQHGHDYLIYETATNQFIARVLTHGEMLDYFEQHYPGMQVKIPREQYEALPR